MLLTALTGLFGDASDAVTVADRSVSWANLEERARARAERLRGSSGVAIVAAPTLNTVIDVVAAMCADVPVVPVAPDVGSAERAHIIADSGVDLLIENTTVVGLRPDAARRPEPGTAFVLYTSGTTGAPKGVMISAAALEQNLDLLADAWQWTPDDVLVHGLPLFHVHGLLLGVIGPLHVGSRVVHTGKPRPEGYAQAQGTLYFGVPTVWSRIAAEPSVARELRRARLLVSGSAPLPTPVFASLLDLAGHAPVERYGMTETFIIASTRADSARQAGVVGPALSGVDTRIVADDGGLLPPDGTSVGELQLRSAMLFLGYLGRPEATAGTFTADGWFRTGDVATIDSSGVHKIVGRASTDLIKSGGYRIGAGEVEHALLGHPCVSEVAVVGLPDADLGQRIVAYVVSGGSSEAELIDYVATELSIHKRPREVRFVQSLPRNGMGKVQKKILLEDYGATAGQ